MEVVASSELADYVRERGGSLFVARKASRCCSGTSVLTASTSRPEDLAGWRRVEGAPIDLYVKLGASREPDELVLELAGRRRKHPAAYFDGCAFAL